MSTYEEYSKAFLIFAKYEGIQDVSAEHDVIYAGPNPEEVSLQDKLALEDLHWFADTEYACFMRYV